MSIQSRMAAHPSRAAFASVCAAFLVCVTGRSIAAAPTVTIQTDFATLTTTTYSPLAITSTTIPSPYGSGGLTITPFYAGYRLTFAPNSGFFASANNLGGGKTATLSATLAFDITFDSAVNLTTNIFEDGISSAAGGGRATANAPDLPGGVIVSQLDNPGSMEKLGNSFAARSMYTANANGTWRLFDQLTGFSRAYKSYHVVIDNDLLAESLVNANGTPGFAAAAKKDFWINFTFDGSTGVFDNLPLGVNFLSASAAVPEPATVVVLLAGSVGILRRRRGGISMK